MLPPTMLCHYSDQKQKHNDDKILAAAKCLKHVFNASSPGARHPGRCYLHNSLADSPNNSPPPIFPQPPNNDQDPGVDDNYYSPNFTLYDTWCTLGPAPTCRGYHRCHTRPHTHAWGTWQEVLCCFPLEGSRMLTEPSHSTHTYQWLSCKRQTDLVWPHMQQTLHVFQCRDSWDSSQPPSQRRNPVRQRPNL